MPSIHNSSPSEGSQQPLVYSPLNQKPPVSYIFCRPKQGQVTRHLFVGNCGPAVGFSPDSVWNIFERFGSIQYVTIPTKHASHVYVSYADEQSSAAAISALNGRPCAEADGRVFVVKHADVKVEGVSSRGGAANRLLPEPHVINFASAQHHQPLPRVAVATTSDQLGMPGLHLLHDFISEEEETALLEAVAVAPWVMLAKRRVQHYGYRFEYATRSFDQYLGPLPAFAQGVACRISDLHSVAQPLDQLTVNEYQPGVGLAPHIDTHSAFTGAIVSLSLGSQAVIEFRRGDLQQPLLLPRRSLLVLSGESRYAWQHYIPIRKTDVINGQQVTRGTRISLTFRQVRGFACDCAYPEYCDSQASMLPPTRLAVLQSLPGSSTELDAMNTHPGTATASASALESSSAALHSSANERGSNQGQAHRGDGSKTAAALQLQGPASGSGAMSDLGQEHAQAPMAESKETPAVGPGSAAPSSAPSGPATGDSSEAALRQLEQEYVVNVYDAIAPHFSATRFAIWPKVRAFIEAIPPGAVVADVGCGNGKYFGVRRDLAVLGSDMSAGLAAVAARRLQPLGVAPQVPKADVFVADALTLPYRPGSCDAVLCIAVLHHISSVQRRLRLLQQLLAALRPGGRALVTVWASEQEDPAKTLHKWQRIQQPTTALQQPVEPAALEALLKAQQPSSPSSSTASAGAAAPAPGVQSSTAPTAGAAAAAAAAAWQGPVAGPGEQEAVAAAGAGEQAATAGAEEQGPTAAAAAAAGGGDYFVPWHVPFHRAEAHGAIQKDQASAASPAGPKPKTPQVQIDTTKSAVVFKRYYHLFDEGELDGLVLQVPGAILVEAFYDHSNWCVIFGRAAEVPTSAPAPATS